LKSTENQTELLGSISKEAILRQAAKLFREKGYRATSLEDVAAAFGVSRPAIYYYFSSKQEILTTIHRQARDKLYNTAEEIFQTGLSTAEKFQRLIENHIYVVATEATILGIYYEEDKELDPDYFREVQTSRREYTYKIIELYKKGKEEKVFRDVNPVIPVFTVLGAANWVYRWFREDGPLSAQEIARIMAELITKGCFLNRINDGKESGG